MAKASSAGEAGVPALVLPRAALLVDPLPAARAQGVALLAALGYEARAACDVFEAHALVDGTAAVIAAHPAAVDLYPRLRQNGIPFIAALPGRARDAAAVAHDIGADGYVLRPYRKAALASALYAAANAGLLRERAWRAEQALAAAVSGGERDGGSALLHLDLFKTLLPLEIRRARRHGYPIAICVIAVDGGGGAAAARALEPLIRGAVRDADLAVRYGEGRFLLFLPHTDGDGAEVVGWRIVDGVRRLGAASGTLAASVGIAAPRPGAPPSFARLIRDAHAALKAAQLKGGDRAIRR